MATINYWNEAIQIVKDTIEYGLHCNDLNFQEIEDNIHLAFDQMAKDNGMPEIDWEYQYEEDSDED